MIQIKLLIVFLFTYSTLLAQKSNSNEFYILDKKAFSLPDSLTKSTEQIAN